MARQIIPLAERFAKFVSAPNENGCMLWIGCRDSCGYGRFGIAKRLHSAHRVAWEIHYGTIPDGLQCLHSCDNPACVTIEHLRLGTIEENMDDKARRSRCHPSKQGLPYGVGRLKVWKTIRFQATVAHHGKRIHLGVFATAEEASAVATAKKHELLGP